MTTVHADFNARTSDDRIRLDTAGAVASLAQARVRPGDWVWLTDSEVRAGGQIQQSASGLVARVAWETVEQLPDEDELADTARTANALRELQALMNRPDRDHRRVLALLPLVEHRFQPGRAAYIRARVSQAFGYPELALLAIEQALQESPEPGFVYQWLDLLKAVDVERAFQEARRLAEDPKTPAVVLAACANIYAAKARAIPSPELAALEGELLAITERFDDAPGRSTAPAGVATMIHVARGFSLLHLGRRDDAIREFSEALAIDPSSAEAHAARGIETYPAPDAVRDLEEALRLGTTSFWPAYYLAHHHVQRGEWPPAARYCDAALRSGPPDHVRANLLEWSAIARFQMGGDIVSARENLARALSLAPGNERLQHNLELLDRQRDPAAQASWSVEKDAVGDAADAQVAA